MTSHSRFRITLTGLAALMALWVPERPVHAAPLPADPTLHQSTEPEELPPGSSLADVARRTKNSQAAPMLGPAPMVISNDSIKKKGSKPSQKGSSSRTSGGSGTISITGSTISSGSTSAREHAQPAGGASSTEWKDLHGRTEADWRRMAADTRNNVREAEDRVRFLDAEVRRLENDFYAWSDGNYRDRVIKPNWEQAKDDLRQARSDLDRARLAASDIEDEARRSGAAPGWLR